MNESSMIAGSFTKENTLDNTEMSSKISISMNNTHAKCSERVMVHLR